MRSVVSISFMSVLCAMCIEGAESISLDGKWNLSFRPQGEPGSSWTTVPAAVPGDAYDALYVAGLIPDPMVGTNVWGLFHLERNEWRYARTFDAPSVKPGETVRLRFDGVDTRAEYRLNGERLGASENMFVPHSFDVSRRLRPTGNALEVRIAPPLRDPRSLLGVLGRNREGGTDVEGIRKAQHTFGWDILPRLASSGIWRSVHLDVLPETRFGDVHWMCTKADPESRTAELRIDCQIIAPARILHATDLRLTLSRHGKVAARIEHPVRYFQTRDRVSVADADLWWPRDAGEPALYDAMAEVLDENGRALAHDVRRIGLRTIRLERADWHSEADPGTFRFIVNGVPVYMHGTDWTPLDAMHGRDGRHLRKALGMLVDLNCNMIRIWGGGVYETDELYGFCDANGICVWQDFMMGNAQPEQNDAFARTIAEEAKFQVVRLRSHPSLAMWCGNNEIDRTTGYDWGGWAPDPEGERISREVLPRVLRDFDPFTPYLPSSPWWTPAVVRGEARLSQDHLWGPRQNYYKGAYWTQNTPTFVSETGYHGCPNLDSLKKMMTPEGLYPWPNSGDPFTFNDEWVCKSVMAYPEQRDEGNFRNSLMPRQIANMFGEIPRDLASFVERSQTVQAEALKYWVELSRTRKGRTWGMLWWNLRDGWPIISDGVVDWYFGKKKAYGYLKSVQQPQLVACVEEGRLVAVNDRLHPVSGTVKAVDVASGKVLHSGDLEVPANGTKVISERLALAGQGMVRIDYSFEGVARTNLCLYGEPPFRFGDYKRWRAER